MITSLHNDNLPIVKNLDQTMSPILKDSFNRVARKLRISVTENVLLNAPEIFTAIAPAPPICNSNKSLCTRSSE